MGNVSDSALEGKRKFEIKREALQMEAVADASLSRNQLAVFIALTAKYWNRDTGLAYPSVRTLAPLCGMSKSAVWRAIHALIGRGYLSPVGLRGSVIYKVHAPGLSLSEGDSASPGVPAERDRVSRLERDSTVPRIQGTEPLTEPLKEPLNTSLRSEEGLKEGVGERGLRPREQEERPSSPRQTSSAEPVLIDTPEQKARVEEMRQMYLRLLRPMPGARSREVPRDSADQLRLDKAMITHGRPRLDNLSQRLDKFRPRNDSAAA
jgi:Helix-turn-helix domain